ncbi:sporulation membrane protein YtaF [Clostridium algoriphilum]|uniref:sporulation membrane protein YtaF n=1 Tax=Clostridium algoriphilum TaxID=198347 RepID=UPI001CF2239A|nr:sporulation membrane protein YtaF [Clostridium algoriphilum]MCB2292337.1 sporulation membrane protein YtaF [Clostridium algoriphilum]
MVLILCALSFSLSSNLDNVVVGIAYGIKKVKVSIIANLIIAIVTSTATFLSMLVGSYISKLLPHSVANILGAIVIIILGLYFVTQSLIKLVNNTKPKELALKNITDMIEYAEKSDLDSSGDISMGEALLVSLGLTFNNLGTGIAASITGVSIPLTVLSTFVLSIIAIIFGVSAGNHILGKILGRYAPLFSGILLILLGIIEFIY